MRDSSKGEERNSEIVLFFYLIFGRRIHNGMSPEDARREAYDAVTLRYGIGKGRLLNIISSNNCYQKVNEPAFRANARALIGELSLMNEGLDEKKEKNNKLISLLEECINGKED